MLSILRFPTEKILATHTTVARQGHPQNHLKTKTNILHNIFFQKNIRRRFPDTKIPKAEYVRKMRLTLVDLNIGLAKLYFLHDGWERLLTVQAEQRRAEPVLLSPTYTSLDRALVIPTACYSKNPCTMMKRLNNTDTHTHTKFHSHRPEFSPAARAARLR